MRVPAIHAERPGTIFACFTKRFGVDARDKPGHDGGDCDYALCKFSTTLK